MTEYALSKSVAQPQVTPADGGGVCPASLTFADVFAAYGSYVLALLRRLGVPASEVEDVAQETFIAIHAGLPGFEGRSALKTWVCGICVRKAADHRRKAYRRRETALVSADAQVAPSHAEHDVERARRIVQLERALAQLSEKHRQVFVLYEIEELPMLEVARALGCPRFTAYTRLRAARRKLRGALSDAGSGGAA